MKPAYAHSRSLGMLGRMIMRVSGGVFLGIAVFLVACIASERRLLAGGCYTATHPPTR